MQAIFRCPQGLQDKLLYKIFGKLDGRSLIQLSRCSRNLRGAIKSAEELWKYVFLTENPGCYPPFACDWRNAYRFLQNRIRTVQRRDNPNFFTRLPADIRGILFGFLDGRSTARLGGTCRPLYHWLDKEELWKSLFIKDNKGYIPHDVSTWKREYFQHGLLKRNLVCNNIREHPIDPFNSFIICKEVRYEAYGYRIYCYGPTGNVEKTLHPNEKRVFVLRQIDEKRFASVCCSDFSYSSFYISHPYDSFTIWEDNIPVFCSNGLGIYSFFGDYVIKAWETGKKPIHIYDIKSHHLVQTIPNDSRFVLGVVKNIIVTYAQKEIRGYDLHSGATLYHTPLPKSFEGGPSRISHFEVNAHFVTLQDNYNEFWAFPVHDSNSIFKIPQCQGIYRKLVNKNFFGSDVINSNKINCVDLTTKLVLQTYAHKYIEHFIVSGNRVILGNSRECLIFDRDSGIILSKMTVTAAGIPWFSVHSHILYQYVNGVIRFWNIADGCKLGNDVVANLGLVHIEKRVFLNLTSPLPPKPKPTLGQWITASFNWLMWR